MTAIHPLGLRERKKAKTTTDLIDAAYALFIEKGLSGVTAEGIAERAGVSRRTFFNYFPTTEAALTRGISDSLIDLLTVGLASRPADESVLDSFEAIASGGNDPDFLRRIAQLGAAGASDPAAKEILHAANLDWMAWFIDFLRTRVGGDPFDATHLATAICAAAQAAIITWAERNDADLSPDSVNDFRVLLLRSVHHVRRGFDETPSA